MKRKTSRTKRRTTSKRGSHRTPVRTGKPKTTKASGRGLPFPIVGVGASAGGFEAVMALLKALPTNTGMAVVVVLHLDPKHKSKLTELVARATTMPVLEIQDGMRVEPNTVYILPANLDVIILHKTLKLVRRPETERLHMAIDHFFGSLALEQGTRAIGVVLSGTGSDGTMGLAAIKTQGGITFAQAEASAKYFAMPRSAIDAGCVDAILAPEELARELARIARRPQSRPRHFKGKAARPPFPETLDAMGKIFYLLKQSSGVDFALYKHTTLRRRISRRMGLQHIERLEDYVTLLRTYPEEVGALFQDLLINVTGFFRDRNVYSALKKKVLPGLIKRKGDPCEIRVWVPGCATGEEAYSIAICLAEEARNIARSIKLQVFGTDLSEAAIAKARLGIYPEAIAKKVSPDRLQRYFSRSHGGYQVNRMIRDMCTFARQNICSDPPFSRLDLISCRNVLIYLGPELQKKCLPVFHYALNPGGYLMLGTSETVGSVSDLFELVDRKHKIYSRKPNIPRHDFEFASHGAADLPAEPAQPETRRPAAPPPGEMIFGRQVERVLLSHYAPSGVVVDRQLRVHEFHGRTGRFLEHAPGSASLNLLHMVRPSLVVDLRTAIHHALKQMAPVRKEGVPLKIGNKSETVNLQVIPFKSAPADDVWLAVLFEETPKAGGSEQHKRGGALSTARPGPEQHGRELQQVRNELDATKSSLQAIIEEQEATNEELKSANEEIESSNEELQSTNEELETAKEELQSTNEELTTLNEELSNRNLEASQFSNDLINLLSSVHIPIVMVDNALTVRRATPMAEKLFNIIPTDIGRRLSDLKANLNIGDLDRMIREVIDTLTTRESKVQDNQGRWYSLRIRPYRTRDNRIDGAVITLVDVDEDQRVIAGLEQSSRYNNAILDGLRGPFLVLDSKFRVRTASRSFCEAFKIPSRKAEGALFFELGKGDWNIASMRGLLEDVLGKDRRMENFRIEQDMAAQGRRAWLLNAQRLEQKGELLILLTMEPGGPVRHSGSKQGGGRRRRRGGVVKRRRRWKLGVG